jgi:hypothetical protein
MMDHSLPMPDVPVPGNKAAFRDVVEISYDEPHTIVHDPWNIYEAGEEVNVNVIYYGGQVDGESTEPGGLLISCEFCARGLQEKLAQYRSTDLCYAKEKCYTREDGESWTYFSIHLYHIIHADRKKEILHAKVATKIRQEISALEKLLQEYW